MNKVRVGIIGLGSWGVSHLEAYNALTHVEVVALCDIREERVKKLGELYGIKDCYVNFADLINREDIDLVSIVTFEADHLQPTLSALQSGKHVLVEKPVSTKLSETHKMWEAAVQSNSYLLPGHLLRFDPRYAEIYAAIHNDQVGPPISMYLKRSRQNSLFQTYQRIHTVYELMIHDLDLAIWYAGSRVQLVRAYGKHLSHPTVPEVLWATLQFENGVIAVLQSNWMTPDEVGVANADTLEVIGLKGTAHLETSHAGVQLWNKTGRNTPDLHIHHKINESVYGALKEELHYICHCLINGSIPEYTSFQDAIHGIEVAEAIVQSTHEGKEIHL